MRRLMTWELATAALLCSMFAVARADEPEATKDSELTAKRYDLMQKRMASVKVTSAEEGFPDKFSATPIFRTPIRRGNTLQQQFGSSGMKDVPKRSLLQNFTASTSGNLALCMSFSR